MHWKDEFPDFFKKSLHIKLKRIKHADLAILNEKNDSNEEKSYREPVMRITRSKNSKNTMIDWVRITTGCYKGDIAKLVKMEKEMAFLEVVPRIDYSALTVTDNKTNKRRPLAKAFDPNEIR